MKRLPYYTVDQAAEIWGVNPLTVRRWIRNDQIEAWNTATSSQPRYRIGISEIERVVKERYPHLRLALDEKE